MKTLLLLAFLAATAQAHPVIRDHKSLHQDCRHIARQVKAIEKKQASKAYSKLEKQLRQQLQKWEKAWHKQGCPRSGPKILSKG